MTGPKEFTLVCLAFLAISCLTTAQPVSQDASRFDEHPQKNAPVEPQSSGEDNRPRFGRSVRMPYLDKFMEKVNQKAIRSPSLRLRFGKRSEPDSFLQNLYAQDLVNEEYPVQQQLAGMDQPQQLQQAKRYLGFVREERKPARLRWGRSAPGQFSSAHDQLMEALEAMERVQRSKQSRLRWGRSGPPTFNNDLKELSDTELASLAVQYLINNQEFAEGDAGHNGNSSPAQEEEEMSGKN